VSRAFLREGQILRLKSASFKISNGTGKNRRRFTIFFVLATVTFKEFRYSNDTYNLEGIKIFRHNRQSAQNTDIVLVIAVEA
jgi:hypothetical protein